MAKALNQNVDRTLHEGANDNRISDRYTLWTVLLATTILLASLGAHARSTRKRRAMLWMSGALLCFVLTWLVAGPVSWLGVEL